MTGRRDGIVADASCGVSTMRLSFQPIGKSPRSALPADTDAAADAPHSTRKTSGGQRGKARPLVALRYSSGYIVWRWELTSDK